MGDAEFAMARAVNKALLTLDPDYKLTHEAPSQVIRGAILGDHPDFIEEKKRIMGVGAGGDKKNRGGAAGTGSPVDDPLNDTTRSSSGKNGQRHGGAGGGAKKQQRGGKNSSTSAEFSGSTPGNFTVTAFSEKMKLLKMQDELRAEREAKRIRDELGLGIEVEDPEATKAKLKLSSKQTRVTERMMRLGIVDQLRESNARVKQNKSGATDPYGNAREQLSIPSDSRGTNSRGTLTPQSRGGGRLGTGHTTSLLPHSRQHQQHVRIHLGSAIEAHNNKMMIGTPTTTNHINGVVGHTPEKSPQVNSSLAPSPSNAHPGGNDLFQGGGGGGINPFPSGPLTKTKSSFFATALHDDDAMTEGGMTTATHLTAGVAGGRGGKVGGAPGGGGSLLPPLAHHSVNFAPKLIQDDNSSISGGGGAGSGRGAGGSGIVVGTGSIPMTITSSSSHGVGGPRTHLLRPIPGTTEASQQGAGSRGPTRSDAAATPLGGASRSITTGSRKRRGSVSGLEDALAIAGHTSTKGSSDAGGGARSLTQGEMMERHNRLTQFQDTPVSKLLAREQALSEEEIAEKERKKREEDARRALGPSKGAAHTRFRLNEQSKSIDFGKRSVTKINDREDERKMKYYKKYKALSLTGPPLPFHATPQAILHHVEKVISRDEKLSNRQEAYDKERTWFDQLRAYCSENYHHPAVKKMLNKADGFIALDRPSPDPSQFIDHVFPLLSPTEILMQDVSCAAIHIGKVFGVDKAEVTTMLRKKADGFITDRRLTLGESLDHHDPPPIVVPASNTRTAGGGTSSPTKGLKPTLLSVGLLAASGHLSSTKETSSDHQSHSGSGQTPSKGAQGTIITTPPAQQHKNDPLTRRSSPHTSPQRRPQQQQNHGTNNNNKTKDSSSRGGNSPDPESVQSSTQTPSSVKQQQQGGKLSKERKKQGLVLAVTGFDDAVSDEDEDSDFDPRAAQEEAFNRKLAKAEQQEEEEELENYYKPPPRREPLLGSRDILNYIQENEEGTPDGDY